MGKYTYQWTFRRPIELILSKDPNLGGNFIKYNPFNNSFNKTSYNGPYNILAVAVYLNKYQLVNYLLNSKSLYNKLKDIMKVDNDTLNNKFDYNKALKMAELIGNKHIIELLKNKINMLEQEIISKTIQAKKAEVDA